MMAYNGVQYNQGTYGGVAYLRLLVNDFAFVSAEFSSLLPDFSMADILRMNEWLEISRRPPNQDQNSPFGDI
jgi:hypothetical protein